MCVVFFSVYKNHKLQKLCGVSQNNVRIFTTSAFLGFNIYVYLETKEIGNKMEQCLFKFDISVCYGFGDRWRVSRPPGCNLLIGRLRNVLLTKPVGNLHYHQNCRLHVCSRSCPGSKVTIWRSSTNQTMILSILHIMCLLGR